MKRVGFLSVVAGALSAAVIGFAGQAQADGNGPAFGGHGNDNGYGYDYGYGYGYGRDSNNPWLNQLYPTVKVPHVDTSVRN
ncbi:hypothetical protein [Mycolicibacterium austroafricanum]|uniref:Sulfur globule protein n=1 Tax=Mycolicibacterium austroafricanum TaxID=39687 RepID=A0ABT8H6Y0_MYCAO|nr:hypothetical protein [Mycolicibacterium austroafricanum]MDN4516513.1 hypothetical protein [Mycolicibacterium austroafricanum]PQP46338.1 hypothetical protein C6A88_18285 [Mycolicibacterium austroafricanum]QRZ07163.1 hypothetical protein JN090_00800 [Mycolicibacterium austroafricanum]QZT63042.1 hypothetical protein JN085_01065 [Mycolicibacterium austroafricanum]QZT68648.1 hypothetical protein JN086_00795 [Mycolicibacterium austroafricanum]